MGLPEDLTFSHVGWQQVLWVRELLRKQRKHSKKFDRTSTRGVWWVRNFYFLLLFMKKILLLLLILACCSSTSLFASSIEHFRTQDWRHMCSIFMENEYSLCSTFGIIYDGNNVIQWEKPFFKAGWAFDNWELIPVWDEVFCVKKNEWDLWLKECKIQYVKLLDWSYLCFFPWRSDSRACDQVSFIDMSTWVPHTKNELIIEPASSGLWWEVTFVNWIQIDTKTTNWFIKLTSEEFLEVLTALEKNKSLNIDGQFPCDRPENVSKWSFGKNDLIILWY